MSAGRPALLGAAVLALGLAAAAPAQELSVSAATGGVFPSGSAYHRIYGQGLVLAGDVWLKLKGSIGATAGFSQLTDDGVAEGPSDLYPLRFRRRTVPLVLFYQFDFGPVDLRAGAGVGFHSVRETWRTVDLDFSATKTAPRAMLAVSVRIAGPLSLVAYATYDPLRVRKDGYSEAIDCGGVQVFGGLSVRIF